MARVRANPKFSIEKPDGTPAAGWKVNFYISGTTTRKDTYTNNTESATNSNPVILDARGEEDIWLSGTYKVVLTDENDVEIWTVDSWGEGENQVITGNYNAVKNGSFETDAVANGEPDEWTLVDYSTGSHSLDMTDQFHGLTSLKFTSIGDGGGYATSVFFEVQELKDLTFQYSLRSSVADVRNVVDVIWYTSAQTSISTTNIYDDSTTNPTAWTQFQNTVTPPSTARYGQLRLYGCHSSDVTLGSTWFDAVSAVELYGTMASQDKDTVDITGGDAVFDNFSLNLPITDNYGDDTVTNGIFATDTDWTKGTGWTIGSNVASSDGTQTVDALLTQTQTTIDAHEYLISFEVTAYTGGNVALQFNSVEVIADKAAIGVYTAEVTASGTSNDLDIVADLDFIGSIDNVSVTSTTYRGIVGETSLTTDKIYNIRINASNLGDCTLAFDGLTTESIKLLDGNNPYIGALKIGMDAKLLFDNTDFILLNPDTTDIYVGADTALINSAALNGYPWGGEDLQDATTGNYIEHERLWTGAEIDALVATSYVKIDEVKVERAGVYSIRISLIGNSGGADSTYMRIYINGSAVGTERFNVPRTSYNEDITVAAGDLVQMYCRLAVDGQSPDGNCAWAVMSANPIGTLGRLYTLGDIY